MDQNDKTLEAHIFVCTNERQGGKECCHSKGSSELRDNLKALGKERGWKGRVRVNNAGCLGHCEEGIVAVLYPEGRWFTHLEKGDVQKLANAVDESLKK